MESMSFISLFEASKSELIKQLSGLTLPKDLSKIQTIVENYLGHMLDSEGEFRQNLTQSEDYIVQAAITLLESQQKMAVEFAAMSINIKEKPSYANKPDDAKNKWVKSLTIDNSQKLRILSGSAVGGVGGALLFHTWGAVFGAIAGTALVLYTLTRVNPVVVQQVHAKPDVPTIVEYAIDVDKYLNIVQNICASIDSLIATYRAQIKRMVVKYESVEKLTIEKEYKILLEEIQSLIGFERTHELDDKNIKKIKDRIEDIAESLENYNIEVVDYDGTNDSLFEMIPSVTVEEKKMVFPAFIRGGVAVLRGKVFCKSK